MVFTKIESAWYLLQAIAGQMKVSVIIPVKNGAATLQKCLDSLKMQTILNLQIIVLDSMSIDDSRKIAKDCAVKIVDVPNGTFNHGLTRNLGVEHAKGELIYFTVQDAYVLETDHLEKMAAHFSDGDIQSVTGIQAIPNDLDKNPAIWFKRFSVPHAEIKQFLPGVFQRLSPQKQLDNCRWDNVNSMYRKSALLELPFRKTDTAEDALWAFDAIHSGWKIVRDSSLVVCHYHHESFSYNFKTAYSVNYTLFECFNVLPEIPPVIIPFAKNILTLLKRQKLSLVQKLKWTVHNFVRLFSTCFSTLIFRSIFLVGKKALLSKSYKFFCSKIPQGKQNKRNTFVALYTEN